MAKKYDKPNSVRLNPREVSRINKITRKLNIKKSTYLKTVITEGNDKYERRLSR
jgi:predicted DNA-binding protein